MPENKKNKTFRDRIIKILILISIVPVLFVSLITIISLYLARQNAIVDVQNLAMDNAEMQANEFLKLKFDSLKMVLGGTDDSGKAIQTLHKVHPSQLIYLINQVKERVENIEEASFIDDNGIVLMRIANDGFVYVLKSYAGNSIKEGNNIKLEEYIIPPVTEQDMFQEAKKGSDFVGGIFYGEGEDINEPFIMLASQIRNQNNDIIGVIETQVNVNYLQSMIKKIPVGNGGYVYLAVAEEGHKVFASSDTGNMPLNTSLNDSEKALEVYSGQSHDNTLTLNLSKNSKGQLTIFAGRKTFNSRKNWYVFSEWPVTQAFSDVSSTVLQISIVGILAMILALGLSWILTRKIVKPINILSDGAKRIKEGDLETKIEMKTDDEFELLGQDFNTMAEVLKENKKLRDEFVFIAAHELRTPVTAIKGYVSMLLDGSYGTVPDNQTETLKIVQNANGRLVQLVNDLLEVARSESGKMKIEVKEVNIKESVKTVLTELLSLSSAKNIEMKYQEFPEDIIVEADDYKLKEVMVNLIGNAIKYTLDNGGIEISHEKTADGMFVTHIKDHGMGMSQENVDKLFSKFFRVKRDETANIEGTGLGLFICKEIVERMGGKIWVESEVNKGSTFSFSSKIVKKS